MWPSIPTDPKSAKRSRCVGRRNRARDHVSSRAGCPSSGKSGRPTIRRTDFDDILLNFRAVPAATESDQLRRVDPNSFTKSSRSPRTTFATATVVCRNMKSDGRQRSVLGVRHNAPLRDHSRARSEHPKLAEAAPGPSYCHGRNIQWRKTGPTPTERRNWKSRE